MAVVPPSLLTSTSTVSGLLPAQYGELIVQPVQQMSIAMIASTVVHISSSEFRMPILTTDVGAAWVNEGEEIPPGLPTFDELTIVPAKVAALTPISTELAMDSNPAAQSIVGESIARNISKLIDRAWQQTLPLPAPRGLTQLADPYPTPSVVDAGTAWTGTDCFAAALSAAEIDGGTITAWIAHPSDVLKIAELKAGSALNSPLFGMSATSAVDRTILGVKLWSNNQAVPGTIWGVCQARTYVIVRSDVNLAVSRDFYFSSDRIGVRATMRVGFGFPAPKSVVKISLSGS